MKFMGVFYSNRSVLLPPNNQRGNRKRPDALCKILVADDGILHRREPRTSAARLVYLPEVFITKIGRTGFQIVIGSLRRFAHKPFASQEDALCDQCKEAPYQRVLQH